MEKLTVLVSNNLKAQYKDLCWKDEGKICYIYLRKNQISPKSTGKGVFSVENLGLFFQSSGNLKQEIITRNWTHQVPYKLPNTLGLTVVGNEELLIKPLMI